MDTMSLMLALELTGKGMLAIFVVIAAIYLCVVLMLKASSKKKQ